MIVQGAALRLVLRQLSKIFQNPGFRPMSNSGFRTTPACRAINRGMSIEAIAALLGHRSLDMTRRYAQIADRTVADAYFYVTDKVDALYDAHPTAPPLTELHREMSARLLGDGYCTRPRQLDCPRQRPRKLRLLPDHDRAFGPVLQSQRDDAHNKNQADRRQLFSGLFERVDHGAAS